MKNILLVDGGEHGYTLMKLMSETFFLHFGEQVATTLSSSIKEAKDILENKDIDLIMIEPKHAGEYNSQDRSLRGQAKAGIDFIKKLKEQHNETNIVVSSDFQGGEIVDMLGDTKIEKIFSRPTRTKHIVSSLAEILQIEGK